MRILFLSIEYPPETPDGIGSYVVETAAALADRGHDVHVLSCLPGQRPRDYRDGAVWIHRRDRRSIRGLRRVVRGTRTADRIEQALTCWREAKRLAARFDVIETPDWMAEGLLFAIARKPLVAQLHTPLAVTSLYGLRGRPPDARAAAFLERITVRCARVVVSPSRLLVDELRRQGWLKRKQVPIVRFSVDEQRWGTPEPVAATEPVVLFAGRLEALKAPEVLVDAAAELAGQIDGLRVLMAGRSASTIEGVSYADWLAARIAELGAPCELLGEIPRTEVSSLYSSTRVLVLPSRYENFPFAGLEAMAAGRPLVCTSNTGLAEILRDSGAGEVVPPGDAGALAEAMRPYLADVALAEAAGERARELLRQVCSPEQIAVERERCYLAAMQGEG